METTNRTENSTIVRPKDGRLRVLRVAFAVLDRIAPRIAARWALRIWCKLPAGGSRRQDNRPRPGHRADVEHDGRRIAVEIWEPHVTAAGAAEVKTVYLVHGWGGWRGQLGAFVDPLLLRGHRVIAFDVASHGDSAHGPMGRGHATGMDFISAFTAVVRAHGEPDGVVAHSLGCTSTAMAIRDGLPARRLVFVAPGLDPISGTRMVEKALGYGRRTREHLLASIARPAKRPLEDFNILLMSSAEQVPPALIIHDRDDKYTPYDDGASLASIWPDAELVSTEGLGHQRILLDEGVIKLAVDYVSP
jgi:pimeloyl-ACP methyl ester carboxylesterase